MKCAINSYCGKDCDSCQFKISNNCGGCFEENKDALLRDDSIAKCAISKGKRFCGECENFPCEMLNKKAYDKESGDNGERIERCKDIKHKLVSEARKGKNPVSYCGHHCDYCFLAEFCGGCRSNYNVCSYATLYSDGECANVKCAKKHNLEGCFDCENLKNCNKGYYEKIDEYVAKATAIFIQKHGQDCYTKTLKNAIDLGMKYPDSFDETGSVEKALELLEKYIDVK